MEEPIIFLNTILKENDVVVIACSGGPDSMCLLNIIYEISKIKNIKIICTHINHKLRKESEEEYEFVKKYCLDHKIIFEGTEFNQYQKKNFHNEAHQRRLNYFKTIVSKYKANYLMTAHHGDDLIETILMRLNRGSSLEGYQGFKRVQQQETYDLVRPLITVSKEDIKNYNLENNIPFVIDQSNEQDKYTRNRFRHHVLPFLKSENKSVHLKYLKFNEELCRISEFLVKITEDALTKCIEDDNLLIVEFRKLDSFLQREVLKKYLYKIYQKEIIYLKDVHLEKLLYLLIYSNKNEEISLPRKKTGIKNYQQFKIIKKNITKTYNIELKEKVILDNCEIVKINNTEEKGNDIIRLNSREISFPIHIRTRKNGDIIASKNLKGHQKVKDIFINSKVPKELRDTWPILVDSKNNILWVPGLKKSKFDKEITEKYDIIYKCVLSKEKKVCHEKVM